MNEPTHVAAYVAIHRGSTQPYKYVFFAGREEDFSSVARLGIESGLERVAVKALHPSFIRDVRYWFTQFKKSSPVELGHIIYRLPIGGTCAYAFDFFPKKNLPSRRGYAKGIGYWLEEIACENLEQMGITHINSGDDNSDERMGQLWKVGLDAGKPFPIQQWISAMKDGYSGKREGGLRKMIRELKLKLYSFRNVFPKF